MNNDKTSPREIAFGTRAVMESLVSDHHVDKILLQKGLSNPAIKELTKKARELNVPISLVPLEKLNRVTRKNHQGVIAFISAVVFSSLDHIIQSCFSRGEDPFILVLDRITDVRNFGAIVRTAECAGVDAVVIPARGSAAVNSDAMKTSAGALHYLPVCREDNLKRTLEYLRNSGIRSVGCTEKTDQSIYEADLTGPLAIVMGSEEDGISPEYLKLCDLRTKIPMVGRIASLNVSVSAALAVYEVVRQKGYK